MDNFKVKNIYPEKSYDRHHFKFSLDGKEYKGDYHDGEIDWLNPHPKQDLTDEQLQWLESEVYRLLGVQDSEEDDVSGVKEEIEIEPILENQSHEAHQFKLNIMGEEFKGMLRHGQLEWFHPKPKTKVENEHVEKIEKKVYEKLKEHKDQA